MGTHTFALRTLPALSMAATGLLAAVKIGVGRSAHSTAVVADGLESLGDVLTSGLVLLALRWAAKPADADHPYGHGRLETLSGLAVGLVLTTTGAAIAATAAQRVGVVTVPPHPYALWPLVASVGVKGVLASAKWRYGRALGSEALLADATNDGTDILSGLIALLAVALAVWRPGRFPDADALGGVAVGLLVVLLGLRVVRHTALQLMDTMPDATTMREVREAALSVPGALAVEKCHARKTGLQYHVDLHLEVDPALTVRASHEIAHQVRDRVKERVPWVADVLVHVEPHE